MSRSSLAPFIVPLIAAFQLLEGCGDDPAPFDSMGDADGDFIPDGLEGGDEDPPRDTDGDLVPDWFDLDSDGDGILDPIEAGDFDLSTSPLNSDEDDLPDYLDLDSDDNGIPDEVEGGTTDYFGDGIPDFRDIDDDKDNLTDAQETRGILDPPLDSDGDGIPNYRDLDSDNDGILDGHERDRDTDGDGLPDREDLDSDNDGYPDEVEAGDSDLRTIPVDSDEDGIPDFIDRDSDNDGLTDAFELGVGLDRLSEDSDGDGDTDLIEIGAGSDPTDAADNPTERGDFVFLVRFEEDPEPPRKTLEFGTALRFADVYFSLDETCSMSQEFNALRLSVPAIVEQLSCSTSGQVVDGAVIEDGEDRCVPLAEEDDFMTPDVVENLPLYCPTLRSRRDVAAGVPDASLFEDPLLACHNGGCARRCALDDECAEGFACDREAVEAVCARTCRINADCGQGFRCDQDAAFCREIPNQTGCIDNLWTGVGRWNNLDTFHNDLSLQDDPSAPGAFLAGPFPGAGEVPEQAAACVADGDNCINDTTRSCSPTGIGCPGFREDAIKILVQITDADNQCGSSARCPIFNADYAGAELLRQGIFFIGLVGLDDDSNPMFGDPRNPQEVAEEIALAAGSVDDDGVPFVFPAVDGEVVTATATAVTKLVGGANFSITADVLDEPNDAGDSLRFVERLEVNRDPALPQCTGVLLVSDENGDGFPDTFPRTRPGTPVCWDLVARANESVRPETAPQVFRARVEVRANGSLVDEKRVFFLVPPIPSPDGPG